jgi:predicted phosphodiesterase
LAVRLAIVSDVHGNLLALEAVLADIDKQGVDQILCGGDVALKGSRPAEVVDLLQARCAATVKGNTDAYLTGELPLRNYGNPQHWKYRLYRWTTEQLGPERVEIIRKYGFSHRVSGEGKGDLLLVHANPRDMEAALDPAAPDGVLRNLIRGCDARVLAFGHLHIAYQKELDGVLLVDVASAGNPRDGDPRPAYGLFTLGPTGWKVELRRVEYPLMQAASDYRIQGVPGASRLAKKLVEARFGR